MKVKTVFLGVHHRLNDILVWFLSKGVGYYV